jgi:hypothetical protein
MRSIMKSYVFFVIMFLMGAALMGANAQASMMGPYPNQPASMPAGFNGWMMPGLHMPGTYNMHSMMDEMYPELLQAWPQATMWQGEDGAIHIQPEPQGPVYTYLVPMEGWNSSQGSGPYMHFDNGGFQAVTSTGTYHGYPAPYDSTAFTNMTQFVTASPSDINYGPDGAITIELPDGNQWVCLEASAQADGIPGVQPGISVMQPGSFYSNVMFDYRDGYQQGFHPAFMHSSEIMSALVNIPGMANIQLGADGVITGVLHDGAVAHSIALHPAMNYQTGSSQAGTGFGYDVQAGWWFTYSGGEHQPFMAYLDGNPI